MEIELRVLGLRMADNEDKYFLYLEDLRGKRMLSISVGRHEARDLALQMSSTSTSRPMTHDLLHEVVGKLGGKVVKVTLQVLDQVFRALIDIDRERQYVQVDARASDAVLLALKAEASIVCAPQMLIEYGTDRNRRRVESLPAYSPLVDYSEEDLRRLLKSALAEEDFEKAARIRDLIKKRQGN